MKIPVCLGHSFACQDEFVQQTAEEVQGMVCKWAMT